MQPYGKCLYLTDARLIGCSQADTVSFYLSYTFVHRIAITHVPHQIPKIVANLTSYLSSLYDTQRVVAAAFFAEASIFGRDTTSYKMAEKSFTSQVVNSFEMFNVRHNEV